MELSHLDIIGCGLFFQTEKLVCFSASGSLSRETPSSGTSSRPWKTVSESQQVHIYPSADQITGRVVAPSVLSRILQKLTCGDLR